MPWTEDDVAKHNKKANTPRLKHAWVDTANNVRTSEMAKGTPEDEADAKAVRVANGAVKKLLENKTRWRDRKGARTMAKPQPATHEKVNAYLTEVSAGEPLSKTPAESVVRYADGT